MVNTFIRTIFHWLRNKRQSAIRSKEVGRNGERKTERKKDIKENEENTEGERDKERPKVKEKDTERKEKKAGGRD